jgi:double-stranded uracil-DNA glycosylase
VNQPTDIITSFPPISDARAEILILGTMPGIQSLQANQYYAHKQNAFWKIMGSLLGFDPHLPYEARAQCLIEHRIAVWDVLHSCVREGSLDADIECEIVNDFAEFYRSHPNIRRIGFNGAASERYYKIHVMPQVNSAAFTYVRLASTSPAYASLNLQAKIAAWKAALNL